MPNHGILIPFLNEDPAFAYGVEVGMLYVTMRDDPQPIEGIYLSENQDQILLMASRMRWKVEWIKPWSEGWFQIRMTPPS